MPGTVLGPRNAARDKAAKVPAFAELRVSLQSQIINK